MHASHKTTKALWCSWIITGPRQKLRFCRRHQLRTAAVLNRLGKIGPNRLCCNFHWRILAKVKPK